MTTPTTEETRQTIDASLDAAQGSRPPILSVSFLRSLSKAFAGVVTSLFKYVEFWAAQTLVKTATADFVTVLGRRIRPLVELGIQIGVGEPTPAQRWEGVATANITIQGEVLPQGTLFLQPDTGVTYATLAPVNLSSATADLTLRAISDQNGTGGFGEIGNLEIGQVLVLSQPAVGIEPEVTVSSVTKAGVNEEDVEVYRQRVLDRYQKRPQSAALVDYEARVESVEGVTEAYPYTGIIPPEIDIYVVTTGTTPTEIAAIIADAQAFVSDPAWLPPGVTPTVQEVTRPVISVEITGFESTDDPSAQAAVTESITTNVTNKEPFIEGVSVPPQRDELSVNELVAAAITGGATFGVSFDTLEFFVNGSPTPSITYVLGRGELFEMGSVNYV